MQKLVGKGWGRIVSRVNAKDDPSSLKQLLLWNHPLQSSALDSNRLGQSQQPFTQLQSHSMISIKRSHQQSTGQKISPLNRISHPTPTSYNYSQLTSSKTPTGTTPHEQIIQLKPEVHKMVYYDSGKLSELVRLRRVREEMNDRVGIGVDGKSEDEALGGVQRKIVGFFDYNEHLASGKYQQYRQYPLTKLLHIAMKLIDEHTTQPNTQPQPRSKAQHFALLQHLIRERMRNCSLKDYLRLVYVVLAGYGRVYKFGRQFIEGLLNGLRREVVLMEEEDLMRLFWAVSLYSLKGREEWEEVCLGDQLKQVRDGVYYDRGQSPQYQSRTRTQLQLQILQKVTKRYSNKYLKTQLMLKQQQLFKLLQWLKLALAFTNHPTTTSNPQQFIRTKNTIICQLLDVVVDRFLPRPTKGKLQNGVGQLENKSLEFKWIGEVVGFLRVMDMVRDYLVAEGDRLLNKQEANQERKREIVVMAKEWRGKGVQVNEMIGVIIQYSNVKHMINGVLGVNDNYSEGKQLYNPQQESNTTITQTQLLNTQQPQPQGQAINKPHLTLEQFSAQWTLINLLTQHYQFKQSSNQPSTPLLQNWYLKLITQHKITQLFTKTAEFIKQLHELELTQNTRRQIIRISEIQLRVMYGMWERWYYVRERVGEGADGENKQVQGVEFRGMYGQVMEGFTTTITTAMNQTTTTNQTKNYYIKELQPQTILSIINYQLASPTTTQPTTTHHPGLHLIITYAQQLLGLVNQHIDPTPSYYIRQLQLPIYTYLKHHLSSPTTLKQLQQRIQAVVTKIYERNLKAKGYLENYSVQYREMMNPGANTFMNNVKLLGLGRGNIMREVGGRANSSGRLLLGGSSGNFRSCDGSGSYNTSTTQDGRELGEFILKCIIKQKSNYLFDQSITRLNKFFTQIKAFNEISFCHPTTVFSITPMFLYTPRHPQQPKALIFLPPSQLLQPSLLSLKLTYQNQQIQLIPLDRHQFLAMHINQRVEMLRKVLNDNNVSNRVQMLKLSQQKVY